MESMWAWVIAAPIGFMLLILSLGWLEEKIVFPVDRAVQISKAMERTAPEDIEAVVAQMLAPFAPARPVS